MKKSSLFIFFVILALLVSAWVPAPAEASTGAATAAGNPAISTLSINNKTTSRLTLELKNGKTGRTYTIYANPGKMTKDIDRGTYKVSFLACGQKKSMTLKATAAKSKLAVSACPSTKLVTANATSGTIHLYLNGPESYHIVVPARSSVKTVVMRGTYTYTISGVCGSKEGKVVLKTPAYRWIWWCSR